MNELEPIKQFDGFEYVGEIKVEELKSGQYFTCPAFGVRPKEPLLYRKKFMLGDKINPRTHKPTGYILPKPEYEKENHILTYKKTKSLKRSLPT